MIDISDKHLTRIAGGSQCQVVTTITNPQESDFQMQSTISGECESLQNQFDSGFFHKSSSRWEDLGFQVTVEFVTL